jgi:hypothetical protein
MVVAQTVDTFQFENEHVFHEDVGEVLAHRLVFVNHRKRSLRDSRNASDLQLAEERAVVDLFEKSRAERVGDFEDRTQYPLRQIVE